MLDESSWLRVFAYFLQRPEDVPTLRGVCRRWLQLLSDPESWRRMFFLRFSLVEAGANLGEWERSFLRRASLHARRWTAATAKLTGPSLPILAASFPSEGDASLTVITKDAVWRLSGNTRHYNPASTVTLVADKVFSIDERITGPIRCAAFVGPTEVLMSGPAGHGFLLEIDGERRSGGDERSYRKVFSQMGPIEALHAFPEHRVVWGISRRPTGQVTFRRFETGDFAMTLEIAVNSPIVDYCCSRGRLLYCTASDVFDEHGRVFSVDQPIFRLQLEPHALCVLTVEEVYVWDLQGRHLSKLDTSPTGAVAAGRDEYGEWQTANLHIPRAVKSFSDSMVGSLDRNGVVRLFDRLSGQLLHSQPISPQRHHVYAPADLQIVLVGDRWCLRTGKFVHTLVWSYPTWDDSKGDEGRAEIKRRKKSQHPAAAVPPERSRSVLEDVEEVESERQRQRLQSERLEALEERQFRHLGADMTEEELMQYAVLLSLEES